MLQTARQWHGTAAQMMTLDICSATLYHQGYGDQGDSSKIYSTLRVSPGSLLLENQLSPIKIFSM